jgi:hypothetical protein
MASGGGPPSDNPTLGSSPKGTTFLTTLISQAPFAAAAGGAGRGAVRRVVVVCQLDRDTRRPPWRSGSAGGAEPRRTQIAAGQEHAASPHHRAPSPSPLLAAPEGLETEPRRQHGLDHPLAACGVATLCCSPPALLETATLEFGKQTRSSNDWISKCLKVYPWKPKLYPASQHIVLTVPGRSQAPSIPFTPPAGERAEGIVTVEGKEGALVQRFLHIDYMKLAVNLLVVTLDVVGCRPTGQIRPFAVRWLRQFAGPLAMPAAAFASGFVYHPDRTSGRLLADLGLLLGYFQTQVSVCELSLGGELHDEGLGSHGIHRGVGDFLISATLPAPRRCTGRQEPKLPPSSRSHKLSRVSQDLSLTTQGTVPRRVQ